MMRVLWHRKCCQRPFPYPDVLASQVCRSKHGSVYIPHAGEKLAETTISKGRSNDDAGGGSTQGAQVDQTQEEGRQGETA